MAEASKVIIVPGNGLTPFYLQPMMFELIRMGYDATAIKLADGHTNANFDDDANAALQAANGSEEFHVVTQSRGFEGGARVQRQTIQRGLGRMASLTVFNSGGLHGWLLDGETSEDALKQRYTPLASKILHIIGRNRTDLIANLFGIDDPLQKSILMSSLCAPRLAESSASPMPQLDGDLSIKVVQGATDHVLDLDHAEQVFKKHLDLTPDREPGGHLLPLENPILCAQIVHKHISSVKY